MADDAAEIPLNPGIVRTVAWLNENGFETCDSGDGETHACECDREYAYVTVLTSPVAMAYDAMALLALLRTRIRVNPIDPEIEDAPSICAYFDPTDGIATIDLCHVTDKLLFGEIQ